MDKIVTGLFFGLVLTYAAPLLAEGTFSPPGLMATLPLNAKPDFNLTGPYNKAYGDCTVLPEVQKDLTYAAYLACMQKELEPLGIHVELPPPPTKASP
jgi:hypothetical protein